MTYKEIEKMKMPRDKDKRIKLTETNKNNIKHLYFDLDFGIRKIARKYNKKCCRRMIQFILFPDRLKVVKKRHKERQWWKIYGTEYNTKKTREHRRYKQKVFKGRKITIKQNAHYET